MLKRVANALDMNVSITISDVPDAPNPIGRDIEFDLTVNRQNTLEDIDDETGDDDE